MKMKHVALGLTVVVVLAAAGLYFSDSGDLQGRFSAKNTFDGPNALSSNTKSNKGKNDTGTNDGLSGGTFNPGSLGENTDDNETEEDQARVLLTVETDTAAAGGLDVEDHTFLGSWEVSVAEDARICGTWSFNLYDNGDRVDQKDIFDEIRLYMGTGDMDIEQKIADGDYINDKSTPFRFTRVPHNDFKDGGTYYVHVYGNFEGDGFSGSVDADIDSGTLYLRSLCAYDGLSSNSALHWDASRLSDSDLDYFEMDADNSGYGIPGGVEIKN